MQSRTYSIGKDNGACGASYTFDCIIGTNRELQTAIRFGRKVAQHNSSVLIVGETGTGKELFAHSIHNASEFAGGPFIAVNCAAIPATLVESVLFGTVEGAYTGARNSEGLFAQAHDGTIFLDEINSLDMESQAKLLRFLQDRVVRSVGDHRQRRINCRIISAVNRDVEEAVRSLRLREDLYFRLGAVELHIPPLRERKDDLPALSEHFLRKYNRDFETGIRGVTPPLMRLFEQYGWPGNVRELEHVFESAMNFVDAGETALDVKHLSPQLLRKLMASPEPGEPLSGGTAAAAPEPELAACGSEQTLQDILDRVERQVIIERLIKRQGNISQTAKELGIFRQALQYRMKKYAIDEGEYQ